MRLVCKHISFTVFVPVTRNIFNSVGQFGLCCIKEWQKPMLIVTVVFRVVSSLLNQCIPNPHNENLEGAKNTDCGPQFFCRWRLPVSYWLLCCADSGVDGGRKPFILQRISCGFSCYGCFIGNIQVVQVASDSVEVVCLCCFGNEGAAG